MYVPTPTTEQMLKHRNHPIVRNIQLENNENKKAEGTASLGNGSVGSGSMQFVVNNNSPGEQVRARTMGTRNAFK